MLTLWHRKQKGELVRPANGDARFDESLVKKTVEKYFSALNKKDGVLLASVLAENLIFKSIFLSHESNGKKEYIEITISSLPDDAVIIVNRIHQSFTSKDKAVVYGVVSLISESKKRFFYGLQLVLEKTKQEWLITKIAPPEYFNSYRGKNV